MKETTKFHYFYKITNLLNNHFYYGVHNTNNIDDGYMGSGKRLHYAYKKYGIENFQKEILKYFDTAADAFKYEAEIVNEVLVKDPNCYNIVNGGAVGTTNMVVVKDKDGNKFIIYNDDPRYISGELVYHGKGEEKHRLKGRILVKDNNGKCFSVYKNDERFINGELKPISKDKILVKDKNGKCFQVYKNDERYISGELINFWKGRHHTEETKQKLKENHQKYHYQVGEKNSMYGKRWINNNIQNKLINKDELNEYISNGWIPGKIKKQKDPKPHKIINNSGKNNPHYGTCWIHNNEKSISIKKDKLEEYISNGWIKGRKMKFQT